ncbi:hypothetical protein GOZ97_06345 [Agrobacterium vitis]|uniref:hypothetical protein n=1 Tax=Rhizobium/Agrobacterium group TaxID=227290 RepID=UPI0008DC2AEB|nr:MULTISPECIES: hypothetical protein [Rhizobium/Agrobacterium group]MCF1434990.1 hypothetical protein [Allorhizobium ampelinum]MUO91621.1 hypothetical protein [Agrobacterium vitis]MUZ55186.1 hypothetical protein [Agrobacterium vitis]MUZ91035.1 hypothetical protein [Agrobacterium vitis]MVA42386.1 hypothetical protein [Agrobacterium vitis]
MKLSVFVSLACAVETEKVYAGPYATNSELQLTFEHFQENWKLVLAPGNGQKQRALLRFHENQKRPRVPNMVHEGVL